MADRKPENPDNYPALGRMLMWIERPGSVEKIVYALYALCAALFAADFFYHKHSYVAVEDFPGFYALYGFFMCAALVICARGLRVFLKRPEDYYAPKDVESEPFPEDQLERVDYDA